MSAVVPAPVDWVESISRLRLPKKADQRLQELMELNNEGRLTEAQRAEMESLIEVSESMSLVRARALNLLGRKPQ
jgi:hypothetical protein